MLSIAKQLSVKPSDLRGVGIQVTRLESDSVGSKFLDRFLLRSTRETQQASSSNAPQEESSTQWTMRTNNVGSSTIQNRVTTQRAPSSIAAQQEVCTSEGDHVARPQFKIMPREPCYLDEEVLAALPEDIRQEVLQTYQSSSSLRVQKAEVVTNMKSPIIEQVLEYVTISLSVDLSTNLNRGTVMCSQQVTAHIGRMKACSSGEGLLIAASADIN